MTSRNVEDMASKLLAEGFSRAGPAAGAPSDPIADTPMIVTLDVLRPYELDPRVARNPLYNDIKASIRERGLDAPPAITRRPGEPHYIIRNGGNTRLAILRELWTETRDDRFFRIPCLFRPWPSRGEIVALVGHLAENELRSGLTFIERALGVEKARELYERESGAVLSQSELARRLTADGFPVPQSHISRMQDAVHYLLPVIPTVLYGGLGRMQVEKLAAMRKAGQRVWEQRAGEARLPVDFPTLFQDVLAMFNDDPQGLSLRRVQDELVGQMAEVLEADYDLLMLELDETENRQRVLSTEPSAEQQEPSTPTAASMPAARSPAPPERAAPKSRQPSSPDEGEEKPRTQHAAPAAPDNSSAARRDEHIVSEAPSTPRLQTIQRLVAEHTGEQLQDFGENVLRAIPVQTGGLYPITDLWFVDSSLATAAPLRTHIAQFAREIAAEAHAVDQVQPVDGGLGFQCLPAAAEAPPFAHAVLALLMGLVTAYSSVATSSRATTPLPIDVLTVLLRDTSSSSQLAPRLSDAGLVKLFRVIRLARVLLDLESRDRAGEP
ncbi:ParB family protein [Chitinimonas koreensis]|uniref:ParB family protein n=1 Tax=Chitinimonas koreensis TaxID=356302 RepID=UPI000427C931|nr:ParB family protein [Chitinimonas koreensis]QNM96760.1 hypothetical protein H9L41_23955 [Chitinimonas koreensis]